jgi:hypothetical protein
MFHMSRPGASFLPWTSLCGPIATNPDPISQPV